MLEVLHITHQHQSQSTQAQSPTITHALRLQHALPCTQRLRVLLPAVADRLARVPAVILEEVVADDPRREDDVDHAERVAEEVRALDLFRELRAGGGQRAARLVLRLTRLRLEEAEVRGDDGLCDEVDPDARVGALERVRREQVRFGVRVCVLEELAEDQGLVERFALIFECRDKPLGVDVCSSLVSG